MSRLIYSVSRLFTLAFFLTFPFYAYSQGSELKDSGLQLTVSAGAFSSSLYVYECGYGISDWKDVLHEDVCAPVIWAGFPDSAGCIPNNMPLEGKIVLMWEGGCPVAEKARIAQDAGALAVLIAGKNNVQSQPVSKHALGEAGQLPAVQIPVFYLKPSDFQILQPILQQGPNVQACLIRPGVFLNSVGFPAQDVQQHCMISQDSFRFSVRLSNISGVNLQNITIRGVVQRANGQEVLSDILFISELDNGVTDSLFTFPQIFAPFDLSSTIPQVLYTVQGNTSQGPFLDIRTVRFNPNADVLAKELTGMETAYRPDTILESGWGVANLYRLAGNNLDLFYATYAGISVIPGEEMAGSQDLYAELSLFVLNDDVLPDFSNFAPDGSSLSLIGVGQLQSMANNQAIQWVEMYYINTALQGVPLENNKIYLLAAYFPDSYRYSYLGMNEGHVEEKESSFLYLDGQWRTNNFYGNPNPVLRMALDGAIFCPTIGTVDLNRIEFKTYPNPAKDFLHIQIALPETSDALITVTDITGREILTEYRKNLNEETLNFPVSKLPNGAYAVRISTKAGSSVQKFIIQKE
ncbi:MAG TPA: T9SS type A sorting domain-containing protein [Saprospiraceae bacterium]|nr:T9SS type A sorting domain-containing protein [Saprospiraceae bacterium]